eukprot:gene20656-26235_t
MSLVSILSSVAAIAAPSPTLTPALYGTLSAVAVISGTVDAIAGGGGLIMMPVLIGTGLPVPLVLGTNKLQSIMGTSVATWRYRRA